MTVQVHGAKQAGKQLHTKGWEPGRVILSGTRLKIRRGPELVTVGSRLADSQGYAVFDVEPPITTPESIINCDLIETGQ